MKLWAGRFSKELDKSVNDFNSSIKIDSRMYEEDIIGSIAHAKMLGKQNIISQDDLEKILKGLNEILEDISSSKLEISKDSEDIHTFIEGELTSRIGDAGKRLHTSRSRNDQVALDNRLYIRKLSDNLESKFVELVSLLAEMAKEHNKTIMPGYTHLQRAQPIVFGHHLLAYAQMFLRDISRLKDAKKRMNICPLGSGALAGTTYNTDRFFTANELLFDAPCANSLDGVSDRDYMIEFASALSLAMVHLSRFSEEIIMWCSWEFKFIELDDAFSTGSSLMPQKKNPDLAELVRGKTGRVFGDLMALLTMMKALPLAYNKDMQEDKELIFDAFDTLEMCLDAFTPMIKTMKVLKENMRRAAAKGFINATDCADYLVKNGMAFRDAYKITGQIVADCIARNLTLEEYPLKDYQKLSELFKDDVYEAISLENCILKRQCKGAPSPQNVLSEAEVILNNLKS